ncbi:MAG TPA: c-type cytochrome [Terriglobales bacterium]|nr:c-type cytochrome [Terriglobales bacterium]
MSVRCRMTLVLAFCAPLFGCAHLQSDDARTAYILTAGGNARVGRDDIRKYGCNACHTIPGVPGANGLVGPPLDGIANRQYIAGEMPNNPENMMRWIEHPHQVEPHTLMPEMNVSEQDSRDIAAYLYTLRRQP